MKWIKKFSKFKESLNINLDVKINLMESLLKADENLLSSISAEEVDIFKILFLDPGKYSNKLQLDLINSDSDIGIDFINSLSSIGLKKSQINNSDDFENFVNKPCRFMMLFTIESNELENPKYILFQNWNETLKKWDDLKMYSINDDIKKFYDKLTSRTIEIAEDGNNYIYSTSNGNDWILQNTSNETDVYKRNLRKEEVQKILDERKIEYKVI